MKFEKKEKTTFLEFRDEDGNVVSVVKKTEVQDRTGNLKLWHIADPDQTVTTIDEASFNKEMDKVKKEVAKNEEDKRVAKQKARDEKNAKKDKKVLDSALEPDNQTEDLTT